MSVLHMAEPSDLSSGVREIGSLFSTHRSISLVSASIPSMVTQKTIAGDEPLKGYMI